MEIAAGELYQFDGIIDYHVMNVELFVRTNFSITQVCCFFVVFYMYAQLEMRALVWINI